LRERKKAMKYVLIVPDGMGDRPISSLGGKTPLEAAQTPEMDYFAHRGTVGLSRNIPDSFIPGTDIGCMSVFGYDPSRYFTGRGPLEAAELGVALGSGDLAFRCNLVTIEGNLLKDFSADHISTAETAQLLETLNQHLSGRKPSSFAFYAGKGTGYRNLMVYRNAPRDAQQVLCTPPHDIMGRPYAESLPSGKHAKELNELIKTSFELFRDHPVNVRRIRNGKAPANMIWLWGQGFSPSFPSYYERYGLRGAVITAVDLVKGLAIHAGLDVLDVPGVTGYFDTNYEGKAEYAIHALRSRDFVAIHIESTDEAGHMGDAQLKIRAIEDIDRIVVGNLRRSLKEFGEYNILVLPDHFTCVETRTHASDPVPFLAYSSAHEKKGPKKFSEANASKTGIFMSEGHRIMETFIREESFPEAVR